VNPSRAGVSAFLQDNKNPKLNKRRDIFINLFLIGVIKILSKDLGLQIYVLDYCVLPQIGAESIFLYLLFFLDLKERPAEAPFGS
jgi:hypothetical protein